MSIDLRLGDCLDILPTLPDHSVDAVITDPPYPHIKRDYGHWTADQWFEMMRQLLPELRRVTKPTGSMMFVLQPNSERLGRMRTWLWEFLLWMGRDYGIVQDAYWLNPKPIPEAHSIQGRLMRPSLKYAVWVGSPDCYRDQQSALWDESDSSKLRRLAERASDRSGQRHNSPGGHGVNTLTKYDAVERRGGVTPLNVFPANHGRSQDSAGAHGHGAGTPVTLCRWWARFICPPGGIVLDPFSGAGSVAVACHQEGRSCIGIERIEKHHNSALKRVNALLQPPEPDRQTGEGET